jgi:hypothetical protein
MMTENGGLILFLLEFFFSIFYNFNTATHGGLKNITSQYQNMTGENQNINWTHLGFNFH